MGALLKFILWGFIILWVIRKVGGFFLKMRVESFVKNQQQQSSDQHRTKNEGDIFISKNKSTGTAKSDQIGGEYVDYEEVD